MIKITNKGMVKIKSHVLKFQDAGFHYQYYTDHFIYAKGPGVTSKPTVY